MSAIAPPLQFSARALDLTRAGRVFLLVLLIVVFEGAIRKWVTSAASLPLILLRDLLALYLVFHVWKKGYLSRDKKLTGLLVAWSCCVVAWALLQVMLGESNPLVLLIGLRFWLLYIWFGYAAALAMTPADFRVAVLLTCWLLLLLAPLVVLQYYSPPGAFINTQVDSTEEDIFVAIAGVVRTNGTFSFTSGYATFLALVTPLVLVLAGARKRTLRQMLLAGAMFTAFIVATVVSGARSIVLFSAFMLAMYVLAELMFSRAANKGRALLAAVALILLAAVFVLVFQSAVDTTQQRFEQASEAEDFGNA